MQIVLNVPLGISSVGFFSFLTWEEPEGHSMVVGVVHCISSTSVSGSPFLH